MANINKVNKNMYVQSTFFFEDICKKSTYKSLTIEFKLCFETMRGFNRKINNKCMLDRLFNSLQNLSQVKNL